MSRRTNICVALLAVGLWLVPRAGTASVSTQFLADCEMLTAGPHRLTGTEEYGRAAEYVRNSLEQSGADKVLVQVFPAAQTRTKRCELLIEGGVQALPLSPMRPDWIIPPVTGSGGVTGRVLHAAGGEALDFGNESPEGRIVVLDYNSGRSWLRAFRLGAKAVIFVSSGPAEAWQPHYVEANANLPRFYYAGGRADIPDGATVTIHSEIVWEAVEGKNVLAFYRGTSPVFQENGQEEVVVMAANLDSFGEVPCLTPGARGAANCAALLKTADYLARNRPKRNVLLAFFDGQARGHAGSRAFYRALENDPGHEVDVKLRAQSLEEEKLFLTSLENRLAQRDPLVRQGMLWAQNVSIVPIAGTVVFTALAFVLLAFFTKARRREDEAGCGGSGMAVKRSRAAGRSLPIGAACSAVIAVVFFSAAVGYKTDPSLFTVADVQDLPALIADIRREATDKNPSPGGRIWARLSGNVAKELMGLGAGEEPSETSRQRLTADLNRILTERDFYDEPSWRGKTLADDSVTLLSAAKSGRLKKSELVRLNRLLIEAAYPDRIVKAAERAASGDVRRELLDRLMAKAKVHALDAREEISDMRLKAAELKKPAAQAAAKAGSARDVAAGGNDGTAALAALEAGIPAMQRTKDEWNTLLKTMGRDQATELQPEMLKLLGIVLDEVRGDVAARRRTLQDEERFLDADRAIVALIGKNWISLHASLLLGDGTPRWGLMIGGDSAAHNWADNPGLYGKVQRAFLAACNSLQGGATAPVLFETASADGTVNPTRRLLAAPFLVHSGEIAGQFGIYNLVLGTCQESLRREGTPDDTLSQLDLDRIEAQANEIGPMLTATASQPGLSLKRAIEANRRYFFPKFKSNRTLGPGVRAQLRGSSMPDKPLPDVTVQIVMGGWPETTYRTGKPYAFDNFQVLRTDQNGAYGFGPVMHGGPRGFAIKTDDSGVVTLASNGQSAERVDSRLEMFPYRHGFVVLPPQVDAQTVTTEKIKVMEADSAGVLSPLKANVGSWDGVVYWYAEERINAVKLFGLGAAVVVYGAELPQAGQTTETATAPKSLDQTDRGGLPMTGSWQNPAICAWTARDIWRLNGSRLDILHSTGIMNSSIEELHGHSEDLLTEERNTPAVAKAEALAASAAMVETTVYQSTLSTLNDLVKAVLILLALAVPFAFAVERLLVGSTNIYRQVLWFSGFFFLTFMLLYFTHPAFAVSKTPVIIFLGFAVVVLSALVIGILMQRFRVELRVIQGLKATVHAADVSRFGTVMAAMSMGLSSMRRRPLRTALTATTVILLTFTILCFASFGVQTGILKIFVRAHPGYTGLFAHKASWSALDGELLEMVAGRWPDSRVCPRYWVSPESEYEYGALLSRPDGTRPQPIRGVLGLTEEEIRIRPDLAEMIGDRAFPFSEHVLMTRAVADHLGVAVGDLVMAGGCTLRVGAILESARLSAIKDADNNGILPVDFSKVSDAQEQKQERKDQLELAAREQDWTSLPTDSVIILSADKAARLGAVLHAIAVYPKSIEATEVMAEDMARALRIPVSATRADGVFRHVLGPVVPATGARDLLFPVLLGGLVIFGTMLGSVTDREREIYTFSALGLAPPHVASLFFSEAMVYSIMGGMGGYLIAQGVTKILSLLASFGVLQAPDMNYSSTNAIVTILIVMSTVLVSAIYPAIKASRSANPGILRTWRLPAPKGDVFDIVFPFTVSEYDITGVVSFLKEHFDNFADTGLGLFMARNARLVRDAERGLGLDSDLTLAPFDLGVTEAFELRSVPSEIPGIDEVKIRITRKSGQPGDWRRLNKVLLNDLRTQFLIWRSLAHETMELYRERTLVAMNHEKG